MITTKTKSLGHEVNIPKPESVDEFNQAAKAKDGQNPCLDLADAHYVAHSWKGEFRDDFLHGVQERKDDQGNVVQEKIAGVEETTGIERNREAVTGKDGKQAMRNGEPVTKYTESEDTYYKRVLAELVDRGDHKDVDAARASFDSLAQQIADAIPYDPSVAERQPREPRIGVKVLNTAKKVVAAGSEQIEKVLDMCSANTNEDYDTSGLEGDKLVELVAKAIKANEKWKAEQAEAEYTA